MPSLALAVKLGAKSAPFVAPFLGDKRSFARQARDNQRKLDQKTIVIGIEPKAVLAERLTKLRKSAQVKAARCLNFPLLALSNRHRPHRWWAAARTYMQVYGTTWQLNTEPLVRAVQAPHGTSIP